jgi:uncharacterized protein (TIGR00295 family)
MSSAYPSSEDCLRILREEGCSPKVIRHVRIVNLVAMAIAARCHADEELVNAGSLLHDVGRARTHGARHVSEGVKIIQARGLPEALRRVVSRHIAAGLETREAEALGLPPGDYMPEALEEKIVCHADNLVFDSRIVTLKEALEDLHSRGYLMTEERMARMHRELSAACGIDIDALIEKEGLRSRALTL